ncbi:MAG: bile acid:sodium symporter family protein [Bacteriovoracaceae bacterium]
MTTESLVSIFLPVSLGIIMLGFGLSLTTDDFRRVLKYPKSVLVGLLCQMILLPMFAFAICYVFRLSPQLSIGLMILASSPGGVAANIFSHLSHGDVALNLTLTAINCVLAAFTVPLVVNLSIAHFGGEDVIGLQFRKTIEVFLIVLVPVAIGMLVRKSRPEFSVKADKPVRIFSMLVLAMISLVAIVKEKERLVSSMSDVGPAMVIFNVGSMGLGYYVAKAFRLNMREATAITMEVGIHKSALAFYITITLLKSFDLAIPAAVYSIVMFFTAGIFSAYLARKNLHGRL